MGKNEPNKYTLPIHSLANKIIVQSKLVAEAYTHHYPNPQGRYLIPPPPKSMAPKKLLRTVTNPNTD
ncbi:MAG: hypothetical protein AMR96_05700 [Candidatus Adiutrix intracellularis]|nr:MAG: hypothetical protein AMR96_05700 [Candidatus Adiutrix intracellularis]MDR2826991.1 hypothetical protein [Candidatus Adiutrix intracellularis]